MRPAEWEDIILNATEKVRDVAGRIASGPQRDEKVGVGAAGDITSVADRETEAVLVEALTKGGAKVLSEEAGQVGDAGAETLAVVDPLDGSSNFERGIPFYCTSVAIVEGGEVVVGVVRNLVNGELFAATKGEGARLNGKGIRCSGAATLRDSIVALDVSRADLKAVARLGPLESASARIVHYGANALELCFLACGRVDAFVDLRGRMRVTDVAAATLIAREAGGVVSGPEGKSLELRFDLQSRYSVIASASPELQSSILELVGS